MYGCVCVWPPSESERLSDEWWSRATNNRVTADDRQVFLTAPTQSRRYTRYIVKKLKDLEQPLPQDDARNKLGRA